MYVTGKDSLFEIGCLCCCLSVWRMLPRGLDTPTMPWSHRHLRRGLKSNRVE